MSVEVKQEHTEEETDILERLLTYISANPNGVTANMMGDQFEGVTPDAIVNYANRLLAQKKIVVLTKPGGILLFKYNGSTATANKPQGSNDDENLVLQIIGEAGDKGIWRNDIQKKSKIVQNALTKLLNHLTAKKLIKCITSVKESKKKIYMLYDLEPSTCVTGGNFYSEQQFDVDFFNLMNQYCLKSLQDQANSVRNTDDPESRREMSFLSSVQIYDTIKARRISKVELPLSDVETILQTLVFDGKVEHVRKNTSGIQANYYCVISPFIETSGLMRTPCGHCPLIGECQEGGIISPSTCEYMKEWLNF